jgi:hypothetical protein
MDKKGQADWFAVLMAARSLAQRLLLIACLTCAALPLRLSAACPRPGPTCEQLTNADLVFIAEVLETASLPREDDQGRPCHDGITGYRFNVLEGVKGINQASSGPSSTSAGVRISIPSRPVVAT